MFDDNPQLSIPYVLNPSEVYDVTGQILTAADPVLPSGDPVPYPRQVHGIVGQLNVTLGAALGKGTAENPFTKIKDEADARRDRAYTRFRDTVDAVLADPDEEPALRTAAETLAAALADHPRNLHALQDAANTAQLDALLPKLEVEPAASAAATLGIDKFVVRMKQGNDDFKQAVQDAATHDAASGAPHDWDAARPVRWYATVLATNLAVLANLDASFEGLANQVRELITNAEAIAKARKTRREDSGQPDEGGDPPSGS